MSEQERVNFLKAAVARAPGKRQIKPSAAIFEEGGAGGGLEDDEDDIDFSAGENSSEDSDKEQDDTDSGASSSESDSDQEKCKEDSDDENDIQILDGKGLSYENTVVSSASGQLPSTSSDLKEKLVCSICLNLKQFTIEAEIIQCDKCGLAVHEACYMVDDVTDDQSVNSSSSTEPWFCEPCMFGLNVIPHCELCPNRLGAFKKADVGGGWVHLVCALYSVGISFGDVDHLSAVSWQELDYKAFGRKPCIACLKRLEAKTGITLQCEAGLCKNFYHVTCAQKLGLLVDAQNEHSMGAHSEKNGWMDYNFLLCKKHNHSDTLREKKEAYEKFVRQENRRMISFHCPVLNSRQEFKRRQQLQSYQQRMKSMQNVTVVLPAMHNKKTKMLHTSAQFLNAFADKAELLGIDRQKFEDNFRTVPNEQLPNLPAAFSTSYVRYFEHREEVEVPEEEQHLLHASQAKASALVEQKSLEKRMKLMQERVPQLHQTHATANALLNRLCQVLCSLTASPKPPVLRRTSAHWHKAKPGRKSSFGAQPSKKIKTTIMPDLPSFPAVVKAPVRRPNILSRSTSKSSRVKPSLDNSLNIQIPGHNNTSPASPNDSSKCRKMSSRTSSMSPKANWLTMSPDHSFPSILQAVQMHKCHTCNKITDQHLLILCDTCQHQYHISCLDPPLKRMPIQRKNCGFECSDCACPSTSEAEGSEEATQEEQADQDDSVASRRKMRKRLAVFNSPSLDLSHSPKRSSEKRKNGQLSACKKKVSNEKQEGFSGHRVGRLKGSVAKKIRTYSGSQPSKLSSPSLQD